ncbi:MAG TPA: hypothetical protein VJ730_02155 [Nitrososphaera sp.]|nr:hypothetical protein [Nitrososphaera sp.]
MTDLGKSRSGPKESDNRDKSLHGLIVALAMVGTIAGSVILFAYASSDGLVPDEAASPVNEVELQTEPAPVIERIADEPADIENIEFINDTAETETLVYTNATKVDEVPAGTEEDVVNTEIEDEPVSPTQPDEQEEENDDDLPDESEQDLIPKLLLSLLDDVADFEDDEERDDENKGKGKGHNKGDD